MGLKGLFVCNKYYNDAGTEYAYNALKLAFLGFDVAFSKVSPILSYGKIEGSLNLNNIYFDNAAKMQGADFAIFWDKNVVLAAMLQDIMPVFNSAKAIALCDNKELTYAALRGRISTPVTVSAPVMYQNIKESDKEFLNYVVKNTGYPVVVKQNIGSQGKQVHFANDYTQLYALYQNLKNTPHHYQKFTGTAGVDIRIYVIGGKAIAACRRENNLLCNHDLKEDNKGLKPQCFRSNISAGGSMTLIDGSKYYNAAEEIAGYLGLSYGAIDFLETDGIVFLEANSNAYFTAIEGMGVKIAIPFAEYVYKKVTAK